MRTPITSLSARMPISYGQKVLLLATLPLLIAVFLISLIVFS